MVSKVRSFKFSRNCHLWSLTYPHQYLERKSQALLLSFVNLLSDNSCPQIERREDLRRVQQCSMTPPYPHHCTPDSLTKEKLLNISPNFTKKNLIICFLPSPVSSSKLCLLVRWASGMQNIFQTKYFNTTAIFAISVKRYISISHAVPVTMENIFRWSKICIYYWIWFKSV